MNDYEDAVLVSCADLAGVNLIATRDTGFIESSLNDDCSVDVLSPADILDLLNRSED